MRAPKWVRFAGKILWTAITTATAPVWVPCALAVVLVIWAVEELVKVWQGA